MLQIVMRQSFPFHIVECYCSTLSCTTLLCANRGARMSARSSTTATLVRVGRIAGRASDERRCARSIQQSRIEKAATLTRMMQAEEQQRNMPMPGTASRPSPFTRPPVATRWAVALGRAAHPTPNTFACRVLLSTRAWSTWRAYTIRQRDLNRTRLDATIVDRSALIAQLVRL